MKAIDFPQRNCMLAEDQPEYETLPVFVEMKEVIVENKPGDPQLAILTKTIPWSMTACFELSDEELAEIILTKRIFYTQMVFGSNFQPISMSTKNPFK
jgi:hypothetical protein